MCPEIVRARPTPALLAALLGGCGVSPPAAEPPVIHARFDPEAGVIPRPTDVLRDAALGRLVIPDSEEDLADKTGAEIALIHALNTLDGWPSRFPAEVSFTGPLDPATIGAESIRVFEESGGQLRRLMLEPRPERGEEKVYVDPPAEGWAPGGRYFVAALGGARGLAGRNGEPVVGDAAFWFLRVRSPLTEHVGALPGADLAEKRENAEKLEELRLQLAPDFEHLETLGVPRDEVAALWSFTVTEHPEVVMDKAAGVMPLPSDFLRDPASGLVDLPARAEDTALEAHIKEDLRSADGFALSADLTFELSTPIDPSTLQDGAIRLFALHPDRGGPARVEEVPTRLRSLRGDRAITVTLADRPLEPATAHVLVLTSSLTDTRGRVVRPMMPGILAMLEAPIFEGGASRIGTVDAESAARVEPVRQALTAALGLLDETGVLPRAEVTAAWPFRTMSIVEPMRAARDAAELAAMPADPFEIEERSPLSAIADFPLAALTMLRVDKVLEGKLLVPDFLDPTTRSRRRDGRFEPRALHFTMTIPSSAEHDEPLKVAIFGHGLMAERHFVLAVADALAGEGYAVIGIDFPYHGERTHCVWSGPQCIVNPLDQAGDMICPNPCAGGTTCAPDGRCVDNGGVGNNLSNWPLVNYPQASGGAFLDVDNMSGTRDHFYQSVTDLSTLLRSLREGDWRAAIGYEIDPEVGYMGQSLGGIMGALFTAAHPDVSRAVLNVPGADLIELFRTSTMFAPHMDAFLARERIEPGSEKHERVLNVARWLMDPVDPQCFAPFLLQRSIEGGALAPRTLLIQMATLDLIIPNAQTELLERLSGVPREDYLAEHAFITIPIEPAYPRGVRQAARLLSRGELP